ncbi:hypothetical protein QQ045_007805 [Rhodiola kirilowii]
MSEFLLGSGFDRLLAQVGLSHPAASKDAIESMATVEISETHQSHCAVSKEEFEVGGEARGGRVGICTIRIASSHGWLCATRALHDEELRSNVKEVAEQLSTLIGQAALAGKVSTVDQ